MEVEDLIEEMKANIHYGSHIQLNATTQRILLDYINRKNAAISELNEDIHNLENELANAWAQVLHG